MVIRSVAVDPVHVSPLIGRGLNRSTPTGFARHAGERPCSA